jgi:hypothetical protein
MLKACDVEEMKSGKIKLSCMRKLMFEVGRAARFVNQRFLLKANMSEKDAIKLHLAVRHMFKAPAGENKTRRHATLSWKSVYNMMEKRGWQLVGEQYNSAMHSTKKKKKKRKPIDKAASMSARTTKKRKSTRKHTASSAKENRSSRFATGFPLPSADQQLQMQRERDRRKKSRPHECCLGDLCICPTASGTHCCCRRGCTEKIHHLCASMKGLFDKKNEMVVYCSELCMP